MQLCVVELGHCGGFDVEVDRIFASFLLVTLVQLGVGEVSQLPLQEGLVLFVHQLDVVVFNKSLDLFVDLVVVKCFLDVVLELDAHFL